MKLLGNRVLVSRIEEEKKDGFQTVEVQDSFVYKGKIEQISGHEEVTGTSAYPGSFRVGDVVVFAKYSPDTHEIDHEGKKYKAVDVKDIIAVL